LYFEAQIRLAYQQDAEEAGNFVGLVQLGGYCRRPALPLINLAYLLAGERLL
jgi:hypothetical protein